MINPLTNLTARPYRGLSVQDVEVDLDLPSLQCWLLGREIYRRTEFMLVRRADRAALLAVEKEAGTGLFLRVTSLRLLAGPDQLLLLDDPQTDVGNASALAVVAGRHRRPDVVAYVVTGRYRHVNFLWRPAPVVVYVDEVVPPHPAKLVEMVRQAIAFDEDLPPIQVVSRFISLPLLMKRAGGRHHLLPCRGAGRSNADGVSYLDAGPVHRPDWAVIGCERSQQIYQHHYDDCPPRVDFCPESVGAGCTPRLTKCCLLERGTRVAGGSAVVPWGANLDEVRSALHELVGT